MKSILWFFLNVSQVVFFLIWSFILQTTSILIFLLSGNQTFPLLIARNMWSPPLIWITGSQIVEVRGIEQVDLTKPHVFVCTHQSTLDIAACFIAIPVPLRFVAKKVLQYIPFLGWYMTATGMIFVDRGRSERAIRSLKRAGELIRNGASIIGYPEGTRSDDGKVRKLKKGNFIVAIESGVPVVPMAIEGTRLIMPKNSFRLRPHDIRINVGKPIPTEGYTYEDRDELIEKVYREMIRLNIEIGGLGAADPKDNPPSFQQPVEIESDKQSSELAA